MLGMETIRSKGIKIRVIYYSYLFRHYISHNAAEIPAIPKAIEEKARNKSSFIGSNLLCITKIAENAEIKSDR